jgi:hypothetical protein
VSLLLGLSIVYLTFAVARRIMRTGHALLAAALFLAIPYARDLDPTHHLYSVAAAMAALAFLMPARNPARIVFAGFFCGIAFCFTQSRGAATVAGLAIFLVWEARQTRQTSGDWLKREIWLAAGFLLPVVPVIGWYLAKAGVARCLYCLLIFPAKYFPQDTMHNSWGAIVASGKPLPPWKNLLYLPQTLLPYVLIPWIYLLAYLRVGRSASGRDDDHRARVMLVAITGFFFFLAVANSPDARRLSWSAAPAIILLAWCLDSGSKLDRAIYRLLWAGTLASALVAVGTRQLYHRQIIALPEGRLAIVAPETFNEMAWLNQRTRESRVTYPFYAPDKPPLYFYMDTLNPTNNAYLTNTGYTRPDQVAGAIAVLETYKIPYVVWDTLWLDDAKLQIHGSSDSLPPLRRYLESHYRVIKSYESLGHVIWERRP